MPNLSGCSVLALGQIRLQCDLTGAVRLDELKSAHFGVDWRPARRWPDSPDVGHATAAPTPHARNAVDDFSVGCLISLRPSSFPSAGIVFQHHIVVADRRGSGVTDSLGS